MQRIDIKSLILKILYFFAGAIICLQVVHMERYVSLCFYATFFLTLIFWTTAALERLEKLELWTLLALILALVNVLINAALNNYHVSLQYIKKLLSFASALLFFTAAYKTEPHKSVGRFIYKVLDLVSLFLICSFLLRRHQMYIFNGVVTKYLTFGFTNPNLTGLFLSGIIMLELCRLPSLKRFWPRFFAICELCFLMYFLWQTKARNALFAVILFVGLACLLFLRKEESTRSSKAVAWLTSLWPLLFAAVYIPLMQIPGILKLFSFMESSGKSLNSRTQIWTRAMRLWAESPIFGAYGQGSSGTGRSQFHNTHIDILVSYGPVVLCIVCFVIYSLIYTGNTRRSRWQQLLTLGFICQIFLGVGEAAIFSGGLSVYLYAGTFLLLRNLKSSFSLTEASQ